VTRWHLATHKCSRNVILVLGLLVVLKDRVTVVDPNLGLAFGVLNNVTEMLTLKSKKTY